MQKLAILGGTFNPIHWGHLLMAESALEQVGLDQVIWVPTGVSPHKSQQDSLAFAQRFEMVQRAIADHPAFVVSPIEANRRGPSYAINTLKDLQKLHLNARWFWVVGLDAFQTLPRWYQRQELVQVCEWLVVPRLGAIATQQFPMGDRSPFTASVESMTAACELVVTEMSAQGLRLRWQLLQMPSVEISSSLIRQRCRDRRSIRYLVPDSVRAYIQAHQLYEDVDRAALR